MNSLRLAVIYLLALAVFAISPASWASGGFIAKNGQLILISQLASTQINFQMDLKLSKKDCRAFVENDGSKCVSDDCSGILNKDELNCASRDCKAFVRNDSLLEQELPSAHDAQP